MGAIETIKEVANVLREANKIDAYQKIIELQGQVQDLMQENYEQKRRIAELEEKLNTEEDLEFRDNAFWKKSGDGPFCVPCWREKRIVMPLPFDRGVYHCPSCGFVMVPEETKRKDEEKFRQFNSGY